MSNSVFFGASREGSARPLGEVLRPVGRIALWAALAVLLVRGTAAIFASPGPSPERATRVGSKGPGQPAEGLAVAFARTYLESPTAGALAPFLAEGSHVAAGEAPSEPGQVAQATVVASHPIGQGRWVLTVFCDLRDSRTLDLAVPIVVRDATGDAAALGAPSIVAVPAAAGADPERPRPVAGSDAPAIEELVGKFLPAYLSSATSRELAYLTAPGATVIPLGGSVETTSVGSVQQLGDGEGPRRDLLVSTRLLDRDSGAAYPASYRLRIERDGGRWYVSAVEGAVA